MSEAEQYQSADTRHPAVIEAHARLDRMRDEIVRLGLERNPPRFAHLIGKDNPYPAKDFNFFNPEGAKYFPKSQDPRG